MPMSHPLRLLSASLLAAVPFSAPRAQVGGALPSADLVVARVDSFVKAEVLAKGMPSISVAVVRGGQTLLERAWGVADVTTGRLAEPATPYQVASLTKQFTATLILKLAERGKLSLDDTIGRYLPRLKAEMRAIRIEQLLNHTSGLKNDFRQSLNRGVGVSRDSLFALAANDSMAAAPGAKYAYSNTGYMLLGQIIEKLYGKSFGDALRDEITRPLGLTTLRLCDSAKVGVAASHVRYPNAAPRPFPSIHPALLLGTGGICTTASDLAKWNHALHGGRVLSPAMYTAMTTPRGAAAARFYGFGLFVRPAPWGSRMILADGDTDGYAATNAWYPAESLSVTVLFNGIPRVQQDVDGIIAAFALGRTPPPAVAAAPAQSDKPPVDSAAARAPVNAPKFVGEYEARPGLNFIVTFENNMLFITPPPPMGGSKQLLFLQSGTTFGMGGRESATTITFVVDANDHVTGIVARQNGTDRPLKKVK